MLPVMELRMPEGGLKVEFTRNACVYRFTSLTEASLGAGCVLWEMQAVTLLAATVKLQVDGEKELALYRQ